MESAPSKSPIICSAKPGGFNISLQQFFVASTSPLIAERGYALDSSIRYTWRALRKTICKCPSLSKWDFGQKMFAGRISFGSCGHKSLKTG